MRRHWRLVVLLPILVSLAACLDPTGASVPNDGDEKTGEKQPSGNSAIVLIQDLG